MSEDTFSISCLTEQYCPKVLFTTFCEGIITFHPMDETLECYYSNESSFVALSNGNHWIQLRINKCFSKFKLFSSTTRMLYLLWHCLHPVAEMMNFLQCRTNSPLPGTEQYPGFPWAVTSNGLLSVIFRYPWILKNRKIVSLQTCQLDRRDCRAQQVKFRFILIFFNSQLFPWRQLQGFF